MLLEDQLLDAIAILKALPTRRRDFRTELMEQSRALADLLVTLPDEAFERLVASWRERMVDPMLEPDPHVRAMIGRVLGLLNLDQRKGVGLCADGLPEIDWVQIPAGAFLYQQEELINLPDYWIGRYPITYAQFQAFLDAPDGFTDPRWWDGLADHKDRHAVQSAPPEQGFQYSNHPYDGASWYDMIAFCRWWSHRLGGSYALDRVLEWPVRLPIDHEWEKAARGTDGRRFPWGGEFISGYANFDEIDRYGIEQFSWKIEGRVGDHFYGGSTAVGIFPQGASPYGVMDLLGTIWDMLLSHMYSPDLDLTDALPRVIRGGTWFVTKAYVNNLSRHPHDPHIRFYDYGFRVVTTTPSLVVG